MTHFVFLILNAFPVLNQKLNQHHNFTFFISLAIFIVFMWFVFNPELDSGEIIRFTISLALMYSTAPSFDELLSGHHSIRDLLIIIGSALLITIISSNSAIISIFCIGAPIILIILVMAIVKIICNRLIRYYN